MNDTLTFGLTPEEATQMQTELDQMLAEIKRIRENMRRDDFEIEASQARVRRRMAHIDEVLTQITGKNP